MIENEGIIQTLDKKTVDVEIDADKLIIDLKKEIEKVKNHPYDQMKLIFNGAILEDDISLVNYNIVSESKIILLMQKKKAVIETTESQTPIVSPTPQIPSSVPSLFGSTSHMPFSMPSSSMGSTPLVVPITMPSGQQSGSLSMAQILTGLLQQNPSMAQHLMNQSGQTLDGLVGQLEQLASEIEQEEQLYGKVFSGGDIGLTDTEKLEVEEIVSMGLGSFEDVVQFYQACDKNKEQTINMLLNDNLDH